MSKVEENAKRVSEAEATMKKMAEEMAEEEVGKKRLTYMVATRKTNGRNRSNNKGEYSNWKQ